MQSVQELKRRAEEGDLWSFSTTDDQCDNCRFYKALKEGIGYCAHKDLDMVVGATWWCKLWAPLVATGRPGQQQGS
ncbi:MAG TPA: high-potential iron-sulfur protein [Chloroflexota bacterium]|nr:high-potential iron-sulfur protein [Chloroflexota bacterium]